MLNFIIYLLNGNWKRRNLLEIRDFCPGNFNYFGHWTWGNWGCLKYYEAAAWDLSLWNSYWDFRIRIFKINFLWCRNGSMWLLGFLFRIKIITDISKHFLALVCLFFDIKLYFLLSVCPFLSKVVMFHTYKKNKLLLLLLLLILILL